MCPCNLTRLHTRRSSCIRSDSTLWTFNSEQREGACGRVWGRVPCLLLPWLCRRQCVRWSRRWVRCVCALQDTCLACAQVRRLCPDTRGRGEGETQGTRWAGRSEGARTGRRRTAGPWAPVGQGRPDYPAHTHTHTERHKKGC